MKARIRQAQHEADAATPVVWLLGKSQSGKTSIVAAVTGQAHDDIGNGFEAKTRTARLYEWPRDFPAFRFLDTRGLADVEGYDPTHDLAAAAKQAHIVVAVVRVDDLDLADIVKTLRTARKRHPDWPVIIAQTCLHNTYRPGDGHALPYPFRGTDADFDLPGVSSDLRRAMKAQRLLFAKLPGDGAVSFVPVDFTRPEQAMAPADYGAGHFNQVLERARIGVAAAIRKRRESVWGKVSAAIGGLVGRDG